MARLILKTFMNNQIPKQLQTLWDSQNAAQRTFHLLSRCQNDITKRPFLIGLLVHKLIFFKIQVLPQFYFFEFCHNLSFCVLSKFVFLSFVTIWVLSHFDFFFSFVIIFFSFLFSVALHLIKLHWTALHCTAVNLAALQCTELHMLYK